MKPDSKQPDSTTPGRPKDSGSRQQTHPDQNSQSGSPQLDRELTRRNPSAQPRKAPAPL
jgi:hypothetical protein